MVCSKWRSGPDPGRPSPWEPSPPSAPGGLFPSEAVAPPLSAQIGRDLVDEVHGEPFLLAGALEHQQREDGFPVDVARLEDGHHLRRQPLQVLDTPFLSVEPGEVQGNERRVIAHLPLQKFFLNLPEGGLRGTEPATTEVDVSLDPTQTDEIQRLSPFAEEGFGRRQKALRLFIALPQKQRDQEIESNIGRELRLAGRIDLLRGPAQQIDRAVQISALLQDLGPLEQ